MLVYTVVLGVVVFAIAWLLNKTVFDKNPAKRWVAWLLTIGMFFLAEIALMFLKFAVYEQLSRELGTQIKPKNPLDLSGSVIMCIIFFSTLKKIPKKQKEVKSIPEGEENFVGDSEIIALGGASNETKDRPLG